MATLLKKTCPNICKRESTKNKKKREICGNLKKELIKKNVL
jgi:hypothetical protein